MDIIKFIVSIEKLPTAQSQIYPETPSLPKVYH